MPLYDKRSGELAALLLAGGGGRRYLARPDVADPSRLLLRELSSQQQYTLKV